MRYITPFTSETKLVVDARLADIRVWARERLGPDQKGLDLVDEFHLTPRLASKYRFAVQTLGRAGSGTATLQT